MAVKVTAYRSDSGKSYDTEHEALRDDLRHMLTSSGKINEASADAFVAWVCTPREQLNVMGAVLKSLFETHPEAPQDGLAPTPPDPQAYIFDEIAFETIGTNAGHGHAWERPDKGKARCGGTKLCNTCKRDQALVDMAVARGISLPALAPQPDQMTGKQLMREMDRQRCNAVEITHREPD